MSAALDWPLLLAATLATVAAFFTPGPNTLICASVGAAHGWRRAVPYAFGVGFGFSALFALAAAGLGGLLNSLPQLRDIARAAGALFLVWMAWRIAMSPPPSQEKPVKTPGFWHSVFFQFINPKGVTFALSLVAVYVRPDSIFSDVPPLVFIGFVLAVASCWVWAVAGAFIGRWLRTPLRLRVFNGAMGLALLGAAAMVFL